MQIEIDNPKTYDSLKKSLCEIHKGYLIRDIIVEGISTTYIDVSYLRIGKDDTYVRMRTRAIIKGD